MADELLVNLNCKCVWVPPVARYENAHITLGEAEPGRVFCSEYICMVYGNSLSLNSTSIGFRSMLGLLEHSILRSIRRPPYEQEKRSIMLARMRKLLTDAVRPSNAQRITRFGKITHLDQYSNQRATSNYIFKHCPCSSVPPLMSIHTIYPTFICCITDRL